MKQFIIGLAGLCMTACQSSAEMYLLVGSYASPEEEGIKVYRFDEQSGEVTYVSGLSGIANPSFLAPSANGERVYVVGEGGGEAATANALQFDKATGKLTFLNSFTTDGASPCHVALSPNEEFIATANYTGGSITLFPIDETGKLSPDKLLIPFSGSSINKARQEKPHLHNIRFTPDGNYLLANDLGTDNIHRFTIDRSGEKEWINPASQLDIAIKPGSGPRHTTFHPNGKFIYLINELSGEVTAFSYDKGAMNIIQYIAADTVNAAGSADIHVSSDGKFLYASNRLKADGIAIFSIDQTSGKLTKVGYQLTGIHPRNFNITPDGRFLLVACRDSDVVQFFERDKETGLLKATGMEIEMSKPVCVRFVR